MSDGIESDTHVSKNSYDKDNSNPELSVPDFIPSIPSHLIEDCTAREKFILERISVLIQQNKWQMEMLRRFHSIRHENRRKFSELYGFKVDQQIKEAKDQGARKWKYYLILLVCLLAYPLYIAGVSEIGLLKVIKLF